MVYPTAVDSSKAEYAYKAARAILICLCAIMFVVALHPDVRAEVRDVLSKDHRTVISTATGDLAGDGGLLTVAKVRTRDTLSLEIYQSVKDGSMKMVERIEMPDKRDGYFKFNGEAINLAVDDVDGDGRPEILAPSFDANLVGHLNIYHYDSSSKNFQRMVQ
jgi:hypothetical protein